MRVRGALGAVAVLTLVLAIFGSIVLLAEAKFGASSGTVEAAAVSEPVAAPEAAVAAPAEAAAAVTPAKAAPKPAPAVDGFGTYTDYQRSIINTIDGWWESALARAGVSYNGPRLTVAAKGKSANSQCGRAVANPVDVKAAYPAFYCRGDKTVYLSSGWLYAAIYSQFHKGGVAAIIAHEFGHHVQHAIGIADPLVSKQELQADCLAGIWVHAAVKNGSFTAGDVTDARKALRALGDKKLESKLHHGTPTERTAWFDRGFNSGDAYVCNHF
ncbi:neutral zinc metallopeptidase [Sporichthya sp.]|uniref:neutral zinc metallopeptidase n=1 Tax=Sporichthya sp. TaxID=65475 RepID=UPI0018202AE6|nr:neutral zinc metallopeptidase [Sporichthya sp.]MBA3741735.1 neutral zinc metallopeptidase [Sporichthya sp.]